MSADDAPDESAAVEAAWAYEGLHVEALFRQWTTPVLDAAAVSTGDRVLDVACGTGVLARAAVSAVGPDGAVNGLDIGPGMLAVAEELEPRVRWVEGDAGALPFDDDEFDAVVCQFGLMFFPDRVQAIREMLRCVRPGGRVAVAVWETLDRSEVYPLTVDLLRRRAGDAAADALRAPFVLGDTDELRSLFEEAGVARVAIDTQHGTARFPSVRSMVEADLRGWLPVMGVQLDESGIEQILAEAEELLARFVTADGTMVFDAPAHVVSVESPGTAAI
ncbi:MAG: class I SAM-dependent methyltransferase [Ilumatobacteraceae bacterium]|nr:class I SAM-dependent methyltransferase [Ilumatobacteraceae bacterium]